MNPDAYRFAESAHAGQLRGDGVTPYFRHVQQVALLVAFGGGSDAAISAALLHDTIEDCGVTHGELVERFGTAVANLVGEVTFPAGTPNRKRLQIEAVPGMTREARLIKLADILANLSDLPSANWEQGKRDRCLKHLLKMREALRGTHYILEQEFDILSDVAVEVIPNGGRGEVEMRHREGGVWL
jgi:guanosine-3',5'-bis(diphosphate) 3'-pyrophosphohydrolase